MTSHDRSYSRFRAAAIAAGPVAWLLLWLWQRPPLHPAWPLEAPGRFLLLALVYPVLEEIVFRGGLQGWLRSRRRGRRPILGLTRANLLTSALFALFHLAAHSPAWAAAILAPSLVFGHARDRSGGLRDSILLHVWYNSGYFWLFG